MQPTPIQQPSLSSNSRPPRISEGIQRVTVTEVAGAVATEKTDHLAVEDPLAIRIAFGPLRNRRSETISVTMRTPGHDDDLAAGLLFVEGVVTHPGQVLAITGGRSGNAVRVDSIRRWRSISRL